MSRLIALWLFFLCEGLTAVESGRDRGRGSRYVVGFGSNSHERVPKLQIFISTVKSFPVSFEVTTLLGYSYQGKVMPNSTTNVTIPSNYELSSVNDTDKGISIITNNGTIEVYGLNYYDSTTDGFLALPCTSLDIDNYEYYGLTYHNYRESHIMGFLTIVGCDDSTLVKYGSNSVVLNKMETLYIPNAVMDYSDTSVTSNKPISFFSGQACQDIPFNVYYCDHLVEQIPPTAVWGAHFLSASYFSRTSGELYRILAASDSTRVTVICNTFSRPQTFNLTSAGSWTEFRTDSNSFCSIESNNPLLVMEFSLGRDTDGVSDPFMMMIPSVDQYTNDYVFHSPSEFSNYITILVTPQYYQPHQILVDGVSQENANWAPVHCANGSVCGYCAYVTLEPGDHHVWHSDSCAKISVLMYGFVYKSSYGQPAGISLGRKSICFEQQDLSGDSCILASAIGGAVAAAIVLLIVMVLVLTSIIVVKMKRRCCKPLSFSLQDNEAYCRTTAANDTPSTKSRIQATNPIQLNLRSSMTQEPPPLPPRNISMTPSGIADKNSDTDLEEENPYDN